MWWPLHGNHLWRYVVPVHSMDEKGVFMQLSIWVWYFLVWKVWSSGLLVCLWCPLLQSLEILLPRLICLLFAGRVFRNWLISMASTSPSTTLLACRKKRDVIVCISPVGWRGQVCGCNYILISSRQSVTRSCHPHVGSKIKNCVLFSQFLTSLIHQQTV